MKEDEQIEHQFGENREEIQTLERGYAHAKQVEGFSSLDQMPFESWNISTYRKGKN